MSSSLVIREIFSVEDPMFLDAMELYVESFPRDERMPLSSFFSAVQPTASHRLGAGTRVHLSIAESEGELCGMRWHSYHPEVRLGFLTFIAVDGRFRGQGIGERLFNTAVEQCRFDALCLGAELDAMCFEVERVDLAADENEGITRKKRLRFFEKLNTVCVSPGYVQPPMGPGRAPVPLNLMAFVCREDLDFGDVARRFCVGCVDYSANDDVVTQTVARAGQPPL